MGWRYVFFRFKYELEKRIGILQKKMPVNPSFKQFSTLSAWKESSSAFFFKSKEEVTCSKNPSEKLQETYHKITQGTYSFFSAQEFHLGKEYDWITNPDTGYQYNINQHSLNLESLSAEAGDIKYVWEKARFAFLYTIIRYDYHFEQDCSQQVFKEILDFIEKNPINQGPNYNCSQEISIRVFNWIFALHYYKNSSSLTEKVFETILNSIYWQIHHVYQNIHFSRIAVRNNHAITETLALYIVPLLFPSMPNAEKWKRKGKKWFEQEIEYQIYEDGTFLQFSMNYHRVVIQLLTWGIQLAHKNGEKYSPIVYERAKKSIEFLNSCQDNQTGWLPNYGNNDGALFFNLTDQDFRNYKPQLYALASILKMDFMGDLSEKDKEELKWLNISENSHKVDFPLSKKYEYKVGGYYVIREKEIITFIRCGKYKDRPFQADNLHLDIWVKGVNVLWDAGSYKYNTNEEELNYFNGTKSHNTAMIEGYNQMKKGKRFIWYHWIKEAYGEIAEKEEDFIFKGSFKGYKELGSEVTHTREIIKKKNCLEWIVQDTFEGVSNHTIEINWHVNPWVQDQIAIKWLSDEAEIELKKRNSYVSNYYGIKNESLNLQGQTNKKTIRTIITL